MRTPSNPEEPRTVLGNCLSDFLNRVIVPKGLEQTVGYVGLPSFFETGLIRRELVEYD